MVVDPIHWSGAMVTRNMIMFGKRNDFAVYNCSNIDLLDRKQSNLNKILNLTPIHIEVSKTLSLRSIVSARTLPRFLSL